MNKRDFSPDKQLLRKIERRFVTISMCAGTQKTARTSEGPMGMDPTLPFYIKAEDVYRLSRRGTLFLASESDRLGLAQTGAAT